MTTTPALSYAYPSLSAPSYNTQFNALNNPAFLETRRPTQLKLQALDLTSPQTSGKIRWEQQGQRAGPWDGIGYIRTEERRE